MASQSGHSTGRKGTDGTKKRRQTPLTNGHSRRRAFEPGLSVLIMGGAALAILLLVVHWGRTKERKIFTEFVQHDIDPDVVSDAEAHALLERKVTAASMQSNQTITVAPQAGSKRSCNVPNSPTSKP
jgi:hypothetical protein